MLGCAGLVHGDTLGEAGGRARPPQDRDGILPGCALRTGSENVPMAGVEAVYPLANMVPIMELLCSQALDSL